MSLRPEVRTRARGDTVRQFRWYCKHVRIEVADRFLAAVDVKILRLSERPHLGVRCRFPGAGNRFRDYYFVPLPGPFDAFLLFYQFDSTTLQVMRILHGARDIPRRLREEAAVYGAVPAGTVEAQP
jgi:toxin ParE1/3/4